MYDIIELSGKLVSELKDIAKELKIPKYEKLLKQDLIYKILDQQALNPSQDVLKKEKAATHPKRREHQRKEKPKNTKEEKAPQKEEKPVDARKQDDQDRRRGRKPKTDKPEKTDFPRDKKENPKTEKVRENIPREKALVQPAHTDKDKFRQKDHRDTQR